LEQALDSNVRPLTTEQRIETQRLLEAARGYLGRYFIAVRPPEAKVLLDGTAISLGTDGQLVLNVGDHTLEVEAEGYLSERRTLRVTGGNGERLLIALKPSAAESVATSLPQPTLPDSASAPAAPPARDDREVTPLRRKWWLWTGIVAAVAGGTAAALYLSLREPEQRAPTGGSSGIDVSVPASVRFR
jgi:hypothetical protein